jgi:hypothetical protein
VTGCISSVVTPQDFLINEETQPGQQRAHPVTRPPFEVPQLLVG